MRTKPKKRHVSFRVPGGSSLAATHFIRAAFSTIEQHPTSRAKPGLKKRWDLQAHFCEIIARLSKLATQKKKRVAARWATEQLSAITLSGTDCLREIATDNRLDETQRRYAGVTLARISAGLVKYDGVLTANPAYRDRKSEFMKQRKDVATGTSLIQKTVREELSVAGKHRADLLVLRKLFRKDWPRWAAGQSIPKQYWSTLKLEPFSVKTAPQWFQVIIWPLIKRRSAKLLPKLQASSKRTQRIDATNPRSRVEPRRLYLKDYYAQFRNALQSLARLSAGTSHAKLQR